jgi:hypothetical protein
MLGNLAVTRGSQSGRRYRIRAHCKPGREERLDTPIYVTLNLIEQNEPRSETD